MSGFYQGTLSGPGSGFATGDTRRGLGYAKTTGDSKSGLGGNWDMGDALSSPIGPYDDVENRMFPEQGEDEDLSYDEILFYAKQSNAVGGKNNFDIDSYSHYSKHDIGSLVPYANTAAAVIVQGYDRGNEKILREFIRESLSEVTSMSVRVMVRGSLGDTYKSSKANVSNVNQMSPGDPSIKQKGYGQSVGTQDMYPYVKAGKPTTDGAETMRRVSAHIENDDEFDWNNPNYSSSDHLIDTTEKDYLDWENVRSHNRKFK
jgi:hypothetical protein